MGTTVKEKIQALPMLKFILTRANAGKLQLCSPFNFTREEIQTDLWPSCPPSAAKDSLALCEKLSTEFSKEREMKAFRQ